MFYYNNYVRPASLDEAYELAQTKNNVVLGGMLWLKMQNVNKGTAIDLCDLGLDYINQEEDGIHIGAYTSLRKLESDETICNVTNGAMKEALKHIVGVQFRNVATLGGSIWGRFGFSDVLTIFMAIGARVKLHKAGEMSIEEFANMPRDIRDILVEVIIPTADRQTVYMSQRNSQTDFPVLTCAICKMDNEVKVAIGARPHKAVIVDISDKQLSDTDAIAEYVAGNVVFGSNYRGGAAYRRKVCTTIVRRAVSALQ